MNGDVNKTWKPTVGGIFNIVIGSLILCMLLVFAIAPIAIESVEEELLQFDMSLIFMIVPGLTIGTLAIVGGVFAIRRTKWGWALAGSIAAALVPFPLGIAAIVLLVLSKNEFKQI